MKTVIFDFNGTLYFDQDLNIEAWKVICEEIIGHSNDFIEQIEQILATKDDTNIDRFFKRVGKEVDQATLDKYAHKKEELYQTIAKQRNRNQLAPGAKELLDYLKDNDYNIYMATASIKYNVDFYLDYCGMSKWISLDHVAYDDGINTNKKDIYLDAIKKSKTNPKDIIAFDDSYGSCQSAIDAGIENIVRINHYNYRQLDSPAIKQEIYDFTELDYQILKK